MDYEDPKSKSKKLVEQQYSCSNYDSPESSHLSAKSKKFYLNVQLYCRKTHTVFVSFL